MNNKVSLELLINQWNEAFNDWNELRIHQVRLFRNGLYSAAVVGDYCEKLEKFRLISHQLFEAWKEDHLRVRQDLERKRNRLLHGRDTHVERERKKQKLD